MGYLCPNCGNEEEFRATEDIKQWITRTVYMDSEGGVNDYGDDSITDSEVEVTRDVKCMGCDHDALWYETIDERENMLAEYRRNNRPIITWRERMTRGETNERNGED